MSTTITQLSTPAPGSWIQRRAKLFEAGEYPDKGVTVTVDHLSGLAASFDNPVPLLIEHAETPLQMGFLTEVLHEGAELFGTVSLTPEADALVESSGAKSLSLGLAPDLSSIREVSLVRNPRIQSARLFGGEVVFEGALGDERGDWGERGEPEGGGENFNSPPSPPSPQSPQSHPSSDSLANEWSALRNAQVDHEVDQLMRAGRLCPAQKQFAKALLLAEDAINFDGVAKPIRQLVLAFLERQPRLNLFAELTPAPTADHSNHLLLPEEASFYRKHFPDVSLDEIAKRR